MPINDESFDDVVDDVLSQPQQDPRAPRPVAPRPPSSAIVVTTPFVGPKSIKKTIGPVTASVCLAAGPIGDLKAAFRDAVGGRSTSIERTLASIQSQLVQGLSTRAVSLGANAVIGAQMSISEFGQNVFMGTAFGTAIVLAD